MTQKSRKGGERKGGAKTGEQRCALVERFCHHELALVGIGDVLCFLLQRLDLCLVKRVFLLQDAQAIEILLATGKATARLLLGTLAIELLFVKGNGFLVLFVGENAFLFHFNKMGIGLGCVVTEDVKALGNGFSFGRSILCLLCCGALLGHALGEEGGKLILLLTRKHLCLNDLGHLLAVFNAGTEIGGQKGSGDALLLQLWPIRFLWQHRTQITIYLFSFSPPHYQNTITAQNDASIIIPAPNPSIISVIIRLIIAPHKMISVQLYPIFSKSKHSKK